MGKDYKRGAGRCQEQIFQPVSEYGCQPTPYPRKTKFPLFPLRATDIHGFSSHMQKNGLAWEPASGAKYDSD